MPPETHAAALLLAAHAHSPASIFTDADPDELAAAKAGADLLIAAKLVRFADDGRTEIAITNAGRYWALHGGFMAFLKEAPPEKSSGGRERNRELEVLRLELMRRRLGTFWWSFGISIASFIFSLASLFIALTIGDRFFPRG